ncbi:MULTISPECIES: thioredoxin family protein [unclassified Iodidimonas]|jgi:thiol:disulfide interchange protein DsbD|uniref:protein-disulfide reductase DsbD family protein n=1 Tax=unclassified Iodidimonas TaxID=2626145 RepID=UPI0024824B5A|nr:MULTISPECIES: thioredoxin family protein [unclassified Iodidimonas]
MHWLFKLRLFIVSLLLMAMGQAVQAQTPLAEVVNPQTRLEIFAEKTTIAAGEPLWLALRFTPSEGWHTYWENYGDSGKAPSLNWSLPAGWTADAPLYPVPHRIPVGPLMNYGYEAPQSLLVRLTPPAAIPDQPIDLALSAEWLVCADVCIPEYGDLAFQMIPGSGTVAPGMAALFAKARAALPHQSPWQASARISNAAFALDVEMPKDDAALVKSAYFYPLNEGMFGYAKPQAVSYDEDGLQLLVARSGSAPKLGENDQILRGVLVITNDNGLDEGFEIAAPLSLDPTLVAKSNDLGFSAAGLQIGMFEAIAFALLGGIILNLMPCVFPVLSLKAFSLIRAHGAGEKAARHDGLAYMAGILCSFFAVGVVFLALRGAGASVGWGFQLQSPMVVTIIALILFALGLNLMGMFEFSSRFAGIGQGLTEKKGLSGAFFTGVLATIVATPCTAPFMASALGFAMVQPAPVVLAIFTSLGLGLALPYVAVAFIPLLRHLLPRPGPWMGVFRQFLAFPIFLTVIWLLWVLGRQNGADALGYALLMLLALAFIVWIWGIAGGRGRRAQIVALGLTALVTIPMIGSSGTFIGFEAGSLARDIKDQPKAGSYEDKLAVAPWSPEKRDQLREAGRPVFVYFTADWCITCKVNERVALADSDVISAVQDGSVAVLKADWTNKDDRIAKELAAFGRNGVPLYLFYPADGSAPKILSQILTPALLLAEFKG